MQYKAKLFRLPCNSNYKPKIKQMKKIKALMFAFVLAGMTVVSCSDDDNAGPAATIDGKWNQTKTVVSLNGQSVTQNYNENVAGCDKNYIEFAAASVFNEAVYFKAAGSGDCQIDMADAGTWSKSDATLVINNSGFLAGTYTITRLTASNLEIATTDNVGGITTTSTVFFTKAN